MRNAAHNGRMALVAHKIDGTGPPGLLISRFPVSRNVEDQYDIHLLGDSYVFARALRQDFQVRDECIGHYTGDMQGPRQVQQSDRLISDDKKVYVYGRVGVYGIAELYDPQLNPTEALKDLRTRVEEAKHVRSKS